MARCIAGCKIYGGYERKHHKDCPFYPESLSKLYDDIQAKNEQMQKALERISQWAKAYPLSVFPEPDFKMAHKALKEHGISLDAVSASNMRHVIKGVSKIVDEALKEDR